MQAVIMAGGKGTRLYDITENLIPKSMVPNCGKPLLQWQIVNLKNNGVDDIIIVVGHLKESIMNEITGVRFYEESKPLGTAGALPHIKDWLQEDFILIYGDLFFDVDFESMMLFHQNNAGQGSIFVHPNSHPYDSNLIVINKDNLVVDVLPKN